MQSLQRINQEIETIENNANLRSFISDLKGKNGVYYIMGYGVRWWCLIGIATVSECYCAMDRDNKWERTIEAYETIALGQDVIEM